MTTRREVLRWSAGLGGVLAVGACSTAAPSEPARGPADTLLIGTGNGPAVIDARTGAPVVAAAAGVTSPDLRWLVSTLADGGSTRVVRRATGSEAVVASTTVPGTLAARAVSADGQLVALVEGAGDTHEPAGRIVTTIVVADAGGERARLTVPGCVEPEAFSSEGGHLFVLDYLPPTAPDRYRVRLLDLANGQLSPLLTRSKTLVPPGAEEEMRGRGRQAVYDGRRGRLFTLYTHPADHRHTRDLVGARAAAPDVHAFVHTLSIGEQWAFCIDLPAPFGEGPAEGHAIARTRSGTRLAVVDARSGTAADLHPDDLTVNGTSRFDPIDGPAAAAYSPDGDRLYVAAGSRVAVLDVATAGQVASWSLPAQARGLAVGGRVYVGQPDAVVALDPATGRQLARIPARGLSTVHHSAPL